MNGQLTIFGRTVGSFTIISYEEIRSEGYPECPVLIIPFWFHLEALAQSDRSKANYTIYNYSGFLSVGNKIIAAGISHSPRISVSQQNKARCEIAFPLDIYRTRRIDTQRNNSDVIFNLQIHFTAAKYENAVNPSSPGIDDIETVTGESVVKIPRSFWVEKLLPQLGHYEYVLLEVPKVTSDIGNVLKLLADAELASNNWNKEGIYSNCRQIGAVLDNLIKNQFTKDSFHEKERWGRAYRGFKDHASLALHLEEIKKHEERMLPGVDITKADAESLLLRTKSLIKLASELIKESLSIDGSATRIENKNII